MATTIHLSWPENPASEFVTKYEVLQSKDGGAFNLVGSPTLNNLDILNPLPGVYRYKVRAVNFVGTGPESNVADAPGLPTAPGDITITVISS